MQNFLNINLFSKTLLSAALLCFATALQAQNNLTLTIAFDGYPGEVRWEVRNTSNTVVASGGTYPSVPVGTTQNYPISLSDGSYTFVMIDTYSDGLCCPSPGGSYQLKNASNVVLVSGSGNYGAQKSDAFTLGVADPCAGNTAPTCSITSPANNSSSPAGTAITINATASDNGTVSKVEFFNGATKLGEDLTAPYSYTFTPAAAATYNFNVKATDNCNAVGSSATVVVNVTTVGGGGTACNQWTGNCNTTDNITRTGRVAIGSTNFGTDNTWQLFVKGGIKGEKVRVELCAAGGWCDYVFEPDYALLSLEAVEDYIKRQKHLPNMPSAAELEKSGELDLGSMTVKQQEKIEELFLHVIELNKQMKALQVQVAELQKENKTLKKL
jgi:Bacterial Ig domain